MINFVCVYILRPFCLGMHISSFQIFECVFAFGPHSIISGVPINHIQIHFINTTDVVALGDENNNDQPFERNLKKSYSQKLSNVYTFMCAINPS